ncbi:MAG: aminoacyl-tRNA hydrolase [Spirochaetales bacterium]|nr:aminoacyl-tRNA hydrolase [Spirochaetales bacterium]
MAKTPANIGVCMFLGNPDRGYTQTRHNFGWIFADSASEQLGTFSGWTKKFKGSYAKVRTLTGDLHLLKPETYYNRAGESLQALLQFFKLPTDQVLVVHDDIEIPLGTLTLQFGGGLGGNNGLRSIVQSLGNPDFYRLRLGIGRPVHGGVDNWVLGRFAGDELIVVPQVIDKALDLVKSLLVDPQTLEKIRQGTKTKITM